MERKHNYNFNVSMYRSPPDGIEDMMNLVEMAQERLKLYVLLQNNKEPLSLEEIKAQMLGSPLIFLLRNEELSRLQEARMVDQLSHWILRLAYGSMPEIYITFELEWFKMRFNLMTDRDKLDFIEENKFVFEKVTEQERMQLNLDADIFYKLKFFEVPSLVKVRRYLLCDGYIYVPAGEIVHWLLTRLRKELRASLLFIKKSRRTLLQNEQLQTVLSFLSLVKPTYTYEISSPVSLSEIDEEAESNFPLCMRFQHETLRKTHHLKYFSRMQYGLFLKGLGLSLRDSLKFWKNEFTKTMPEDRFWRKYSYLFKHQYGTVGSKIDYPPYNCEQIIKKFINVNQTHGCPYKHWDEELLARKLREYRISQVEVRAILKLKSEKKYTGACARCFECIRCRKPEGPITHPNQYYADSCRDIEDIFEDSE